MDPSDVNAEMNDVSPIMKNWEDMQQQLHTANRKLKLQEALIEEFKCEIDFLQSRQTDHTKCEARIHELENVLALSRSNVFDLESDILTRDKQIETLEDEIRLKDECAKQQSHEVVQNSSQEIDLKLENMLLEQKCTDLIRNLECQEQWQKRDQQLLEEFKKEMHEMKELLNCKKDEIKEKSRMIDKLNEQVVILQLEIQTHKQIPLDDGSRGNSLFAEVNDRRIHLQKYVDEMKSSYTFLQQERSKHQKLIAQLRLDYATVQDRWKNDMQQLEDEHDAIVASLKNRLRVLTDINERQSRQLEKYPNDLFSESSAGCEFYLSLLEAKSVEIEKLETTLRNLTLSEYMMASKLTQAKKEIRQLNMANLELEKRIENDKKDHTLELDSDVFPRFTINQELKGKEIDPFVQSTCQTTIDLQEPSKCFDDTSIDNKVNSPEPTEIIDCEVRRTVRFTDNKKVSFE